MIRQIIVIIRKKKEIICRSSVPDFSLLTVIKRND